MKPTGTAALAALATLAFSAAVAAAPNPVYAAPAPGGASTHPAWGWPDCVTPAAPACWVEREVYDAEGRYLGRRRVNLIG